MSEKVKQCPVFAQTLCNSMGQKLIETTNNEYWAEGKSRKLQNILGQLLMCFRGELHGSQIMSSSRSRMQVTTSYPVSFVLKQAI